MRPDSVVKNTRPSDHVGDDAASDPILRFQRIRPVVVFSALGDDETREAALASGAQGYLVKSKADFDQIRKCIESHLPV